jgi:hypothetical protein
VDSIVNEVFQIEVFLQVAADPQELDEATAHKGVVTLGEALLGLKDLGAEKIMNLNGKIVRHRVVLFVVVVPPPGQALNYQA